MDINDLPNFLYSILVFLSAMFGAWNLLNYKEFNRLKIENDFLKLKLKNEQRGKQSLHEEC